MHEPAGVVEILVQNPQNTPYSEVQNTPSPSPSPPKWKLSESPTPRVSEFPPPKWKLSEIPTPRLSEYLPKWKLSQSPHPRVSEYPPQKKENCHIVQIWEFQNTRPMKIVTESKSESFIIPPQNENCHIVQIWEFQNTPQSEKLQISNFRIVLQSRRSYVETNL